MADTEEYFPRGGKKPIVQHFKQSSNFLGAPEKSEKKKKRTKKRSDGDDGYLSDEAARDGDKSVHNCAIGLSYKTAKPGVLVLGRVRNVMETKVNVMMPCKLMGYVMACHISEPYNKQLEAYVNDQVAQVRELPTMFRPGQYVALRVMEVADRSLMMSMMPQHVNGGKAKSDLHTGCILQAAVSSVEDHGYVMDIGVPNTTAFMPKKCTNPELDLDVGMITWCCVKSAGEADSSVVTLTSSLEALQAGFTRKRQTTLAPNTAVDFVVDQPLENGIEGHIFKDTTAYIQRQHADSVRGKKPTLGQKIRARVLYVMPTSNTPFLTMKDIFSTTFPDLATEQVRREGDIVDNAQVVKISGRCVHLSLGGGSAATMSLKRVLVDEDRTDEEVIGLTYPVGSTHRVRILCYNLSDYTYSVSDQPSVLEERYFSLEGLNAGDIVEGTVKAVTDRNVMVTVGRMTGFVPHSHISDAGVVVDPKKASNSKLPKKKYKEGQAVKARVLSVDVQKQSLVLSLKPSLLKDLEPLVSYEDAQIGKAYTGVIKFIRDYLLVSFFNGVTAFVPRSYVTRDETAVLTEAFHIGQIVNCTILKVDPEAKKMTGSLTTTPFWPEKKREFNKRKNDNQEDNETPKKKQRTDSESSDQTKKKKKDKQHREIDIETDEIENTKQRKKKEKKLSVSEQSETDTETGTKGKKEKNKKKKKDTQDNESDNEEEETKTTNKSKKNNKKEEISEESDAIETDVYDDDQLLTPQEQGLVDFSDCTTSKQFKKRTVSLLKAIKARTNRVDRIEKKILSLESKGITPKNKVYHTAMHMDKLVTQERIKKLMEALIISQEKLKEVGYSKNPDYVKKKDLKKAKKEAAAAVTKNISESEMEDKKIEKDVKNIEKAVKKKSVKEAKVQVVESLEPVLEVPSAKDLWSATEDVAPARDDSSSSEDEDQEQPKKKRKKLTVAEKLSKVRQEEERIRALESQAVSSDVQPRSSEQFQRALLASPDCSQLWIAYMAFHLQATEIEKARSVGRKALSTINFREEDERLNVWLAMLNCEHRFGTQETQQSTLQEALQMNDTFKIHSKLLDILVETGKQQELCSLVDLMMRKYKRDPQNYILCGSACFKLELVDKARQVMQKAIAVLEKKDHVTVLVQFALLERSHGAGERAEALFEQVLAVYPQRVDVCAAYVDMLLKTADADAVRQVMERMTSQKLPARKMKVLYKKWIEAEEKFGDKTQVETIRQRAMEFIDKAKF